MNILLVFFYDVEGEPNWGDGRYTLTLAESLHAHHKLILATRNKRSREQSEIINGLSIIRSDSNSDMYYLAQPTLDSIRAWSSTYAEYLIRYLAEVTFLPDIIHDTNGFFTHELSLQLADYFQVPLCSTIHFLNVQYELLGIHDGGEIPTTDAATIEKSVLERSQAVICPSPLVQELCLRYFRVASKRLFVVPHGLDIELIESCIARRDGRFENSKADMFVRLSNNRLKVVFAGRLDSLKGASSFLRIANRLANRWPGVDFIVCGDGPLRASLESTFSSPNVVFLGYLGLQDLYRVLACSDVFCSMSLTETFGLGILEAMAIGLPVVCTGGRTIHPLVVDGVTGFVEELAWHSGLPEVDEISYSKKVELLICNSELRIMLGDQAQAHVCANYTADLMAERTAAVYEQALSSTLSTFQ